MSNVLDGDISTFWHSEWGSGTYTFPHYIQVDLRRKVRINRIGLQHRQNKTMANGVEFYGTNKQNGSLEKFGTFNMDQSAKTSNITTCLLPWNTVMSGVFSQHRVQGMQRMQDWLNWKFGEMILMNK